MESDWQINLTKIKDRGQYLLQSEKMVDCRFLVGTSPNESIIAAHRLLLAMASPVLERMFFGSLPENDDPIIIPDVQPDAFKAMLNYIYTDEVSISSFDDACVLYYVANKYIMPHLVEHCKQFLLSNLSPKNACRAYEFAKLYEEPRVMESSMKCITTNTLEVITDPSFMDIEVSTLMTILDQDSLNIDSELDLFNCLLKLANERGIFDDGDKDNTNDAGSKNASDVKKIKLESEGSDSVVASTSAATSSNVSNVADEMVEVNSSSSASGNAVESPADINNLMEAQFNTIDKAVLRQAVKKIRFLTMTPQEFAEGPARSKLLQQNEVLPILTKLVSPTINEFLMPEGFCQSGTRDRGNKDHNYLENIYRLTFKVNRNINLMSIQIALRHPCQEVTLSAYIQNMQGSEIACTSSINHLSNTIFELHFNSPVLIDRNQNYNINVNNMHGYNFLLASLDREMVFNGVEFNILEVYPHHRDFNSPIRSVVFST